MGDMNNCLRCQHPGYIPSRVCPKCGFTCDSTQLEALSRLEWMLAELDTWDGLGLAQESAEGVRKHYLARLHNLQTDLGLRWPRFTDAEAKAAWPELIQLETLFQRIDEWTKADYLVNGFISREYARLLELRSRLEGHPRLDYPVSEAEQVEVVEFLLRGIVTLHNSFSFKSSEVEQKVRESLLKAKAGLELHMRSKEHPAPEPAPESPPASAPIKPPPSPAPIISTPPAPPAPKTPFREQLWRSILSERTLHALLFLGIFLLFAAAVSFVIWGWKDFPAPVRVAIPSGFTFLFFFLGWWVQTKTALYRSGIALSAIASLFIPIDSYTVYANYGSPPQGWPEFWLVTSAICFGAYTLSAFLIQSRLFGYLTGIAAGSLVLSALEVFHIPRDWYTAGLSALAVGLLLLATWLSRLENASRWRFFADPFRYLALILPAVLMPLTLGLRLVTRDTFDALHYAMTVNWFLGGFIFGWGAIYYRSRSLGILAAISLPVAVYMGQGALFFQTGTNPAWHAFGLACLTPIYLLTGYKLLGLKSLPTFEPASQSQETLDSGLAILHAHGRTALNWGAALILIAALLPFSDLTSGAAAAASHAILTGSMVMAVAMWKRPAHVHLASLFAFIAATFAMTELDLPLEQLSVGWVSLAILHIVLALALNREGARIFLPRMVVSGYFIAALAVFPPLFLYEGDLLVYTLGNWLALTAWGAYLAHRGQPGFRLQEEKPGAVNRLFQSGAIFHWLTALPLPFWIWALLTNNHPADVTLPLALAALAWGMVFTSHWLKFAGLQIRRPWRLTGLLVSLAAPLAASVIDPQGYTPPIVLLAVGLLYFADTLASRQSAEFYPAGLVTTWGLTAILNKTQIDGDFVSLVVCGLVSAYFLSGLLAERFKRADFKFLAPLYHTAHLVSLVVLFRIYLIPLDDLFGLRAWTDQNQLLGGLAQLVLAVMYGLFAWGRYQERWAYIAAWTGAGGGGFIVLLYSTGQGSLAAKGALIAIAFVLAERALYYFKSHAGLKSRLRAFTRLAWWLFRRPLLVTGWAGSAAIIGLALIRNLVLLGGGRIQQVWAVVGLLLITGLYALSARLFRQARFVWLAAGLLFIPWTILTNLGWFTAWQPTLTEFAIPWVGLAWFLFLLGLLVSRYAPASYALPLKVGPQLLLPFAMLWAVADTQSSLYTVGLSIALYGLAAWLKHRQQPAGAFTATKFLYPALSLLPLWCVYWLDFILPAARHEHFGLLLLPFGALGLIGGRWLEGLAARPELRRAYGLPSYLTGYITLIIGVLLTAHLPVLLAMALLYAAALMAASAWLFRSALWVYPAAGLAALAWLVALSEGGIPLERRGWWLIGLAALYLALSWLLRRVNLKPYGAATLSAGFALVALGLPPSSQDKVGALWGYGGAALLYAVSAFWLRQPLLLSLACGLVVVPYASALQLSPVLPDYYGLLLFPGALLAILLGWWADIKRGALNDFPWADPSQWPQAFAERLFRWWGLPLYVLGLGLASFAPAFTNARADLTALNFLLLIPFYAWAVFRFRSRFWLGMAALAAHLSLGYYLSHLGWWQLDPAGGWLRFLPLTVLTAALALGLEKRFQEGSPLHTKRIFVGWSRPLYLFLGIDIFLAQLGGMQESGSGMFISLVHALLVGVLASVWRSGGLPYLAALLGLVSVLQWRAAGDFAGQTIPIFLSGLALGYGLFGFGFALLWRRGRPQPGESPEPVWEQILSLWEKPLQRSSMLLSFLALGFLPILGLHLVTWTVRALFGMTFRDIVELQTVWMVIWTFSLVGLLYSAAAAAWRRLRLGYLAAALLLAGWFLYAFYVNTWDGLRLAQWYALPAGLYLLAVGYLEWRNGNRALARRLDQLAILLMLGSLFWQTLEFGWWFALALGAEGFAAFWWGSARRLRRFFYAGMVGVMLAVLGQLLNSLQYVNQWITFGLIGLGLVLIAILVERKLEAIKAWQAVLETWE